MAISILSQPLYALWQTSASRVLGIFLRGSSQVAGANIVTLPSSRDGV
jgi:hypothetical protein